MQEKIYDMLVDENEITWQSLIYDLVKSEELDPWDIDITLLTEKYLEKIRELQEHNFFLSGKMVLAASLLLRFKSVKLVESDIADFDALLYQQEEDLLGDIEDGSDFQHPDAPHLLIKTPQARKRKINLNELMDALQQALQVEHRRVIRKGDEKVLREVYLPIKKVDISDLIKKLYSRIKDFFKQHPRVTFSQLIPSQSKEDKIYTFIPLLHLENQGKVDLFQEKAFGEIDVTEHQEDDDEKIINNNN